MMAIATPPGSLPGGTGGSAGAAIAVKLAIATNTAAVNMRDNCMLMGSVHYIFLPAASPGNNSVASANVLLTTPYSLSLTTYPRRLLRERTFPRGNFHFRNNTRTFKSIAPHAKSTGSSWDLLGGVSLPDCQGSSAGPGGILRAAMVCFGQRRRSTRETDMREDRGADGSKRGPTPVANTGRRSCIHRHYIRRGSFAPSLRISFANGDSLWEPAAVRVGCFAAGCAGASSKQRAGMTILL